MTVLECVVGDTSHFLMLILLVQFNKKLTVSYRSQYCSQKFWILIWVAGQPFSDFFFFSERNTLDGSFSEATYFLNEWSTTLINGEASCKEAIELDDEHITLRLHWKCVSWGFSANVLLMLGFLCRHSINRKMLKWSLTSGGSAFPIKTLTFAPPSNKR